MSGISLYHVWTFSYSKQLLLASSTLRSRHLATSICFPSWDKIVQITKIYILSKYLCMKAGFSQTQSHILLCIHQRMYVYGSTDYVLWILIKFWTNTFSCLWCSYFPSLPIIIATCSTGTIVNNVHIWILKSSVREIVSYSCIVLNWKANHLLSNKPYNNIAHISI